MNLPFNAVPDTNQLTNTEKTFIVMSICKCSEGEEYVSNPYREESQALPAGRDSMEVLMEGSSGTASVN